MLEMYPPKKQNMWNSSNHNKLKRKLSFGLWWEKVSSYGDVRLSTRPTREKREALLPRREAFDRYFCVVRRTATLSRTASPHDAVNRMKCGEKTPLKSPYGTYTYIYIPFDVEKHSFNFLFIIQDFFLRKKSIAIVKLVANKVRYSFFIC